MLTIGLMSGTSLDGVDAVVAEFTDELSTDSLAPPCVLAHTYVAFPLALRTELLALNSPGTNELHRAALVANTLVRHYAQAVHVLMQQTSLKRSQISAIGAHGQTVRHQPRAFDGVGYTLQLNQPALLAEWCGIDVIADFRSRDVAAGGQGAPLVPVFHQAIFGQLAASSAWQAVLNLGGISNLTVLSPQGDVLGFDAGPANALMDYWCQSHSPHFFDEGGRWAASGQVIGPLLAAMQQEPYFASPAPKSTGRDTFHAQWLHQHLLAWPGLAPEDVQATLAELTAWSCIEALNQYAPRAQHLWVCGGGALNDYVMSRLVALASIVNTQTQVQSTLAAGWPPLHIEAAAFAWLAWAFKQRIPASLPQVTGARGGRVLGALYPA